jgi:hypothetical protein
VPLFVFVFVPGLPDGNGHEHGLGLALGLDRQLLRREPQPNEARP